MSLSTREIPLTSLTQLLARQAALRVRLRTPRRGEPGILRAVRSHSPRAACTARCLADFFCSSLLPERAARASLLLFICAPAGLVYR